ncbi:MAG: hypothetical protein GY838_17005 [bacterium]|nr:hypothetical protein [bacterium]
MMEHCHPMNELADLAGLPTGDPRRRHLEDCPRCRGLAAAQGLFLEPGDTSDLPDLVAADAELAGRLQSALATPPGAVTRPTRRRANWYALAAVLAVCAVGLTASELWRGPGGTGPRVGEYVRGDEAVGLAVTTGEGFLRCDWPAAPEAETFVFALLDAGLAEVERHQEVRPGFEKSVTDLPATAVYCQAFAVSRGDTIARSGIVALRPARE